jgi:hypothetical protein
VLSKTCLKKTDGWDRMTVFRVDFENDVATVVKELKDAEIDKATDEWRTAAVLFTGDWIKAVEAAEVAVKHARELGKVCDGILKEKSLDAAKRKAATHGKKLAEEFVKNTQAHGLF